MVGPSDFIASQVYSFTIIIIIVAIIISHNGNHYHYCHHNNHHCHHHHHFDQWSPTTGLAVPLTCCVLLNKRVSVLQSFQRSKHLKGQLDLPVCKVTFFGSKQLSWIPMSVTLRFWIIKEASWIPLSLTILDHKGCQLDPPVCNLMFLDQSRSVGSPCL